MLKKLLFLLFSILIFGCGGNKPSAADGEKLREYAGDLVNRSLYKQAVAAYESYLRDFRPDDRETANLYYTVANLYFDRLRNYEEALAYYLKIKHFYPGHTLIPEVNKKIIACLERLDRGADARQALEETVHLDPTRVAKKRPGAVVARIGTREVTQGDLNFEIDQLPPSVRDQFRDHDKKVAFLQEYVATELLYDTAKRAGLDNDAQVVEGAFQSKKMLMVRRLLQDKIADRININEGDVDLYYQAHKDDYAEKDDKGKVKHHRPLNEVRQQVTQDLYRQKYQQAFQELISRTMLSENVQFYNDQVQ